SGVRPERARAMIWSRYSGGYAGRVLGTSISSFSDKVSESGHLSTEPKQDQVGRGRGAVVPGRPRPGRLFGRSVGGLGAPRFGLWLARPVTGANHGFVWGSLGARCGPARGGCPAAARSPVTTCRAGTCRPG